MINKLPIYLDYNATSPVDARVLDVMLPYFTSDFGNASSKLHAYGWVAEQAVEDARAKVAQLIHADAEEIIFTSGATEAINIALQGFSKLNSTKGKHIITTKTEHKAVLENLTELENKGFQITYLSVNRFGHIDLEELEECITDSTILLCIMYANNETGVINPVKEIGAIAQKHKIPFFCDATQAAGKVMIDVEETAIDMLCLSAHKMYGPKGVGALYIKKTKPSLRVAPIFFGGGHEKKLRAGTLNVPSIVGLGAACKLATDNFWNYGLHTSKLRTILEQHLTLLPNVFINGDTRERLCNTTNICFDNFNISNHITQLNSVAFATGSACSSNLPEPSHVLIAMGLNKQQAQSSVRFSLGITTTLEEIQKTIALFTKVYQP